MTDDASQAGPAQHRPANRPAPRPASSDAPGRGPQARFEFLAADQHEPATVRAAGDIDLTNVAEFQAVLDQAVLDQAALDQAVLEQAALDQADAAARAITIDLTAVTYCDSATIRALFIAARRNQLTIQVSPAGPVTETLMKISGLDQVATVLTLD